MVSGAANRDEIIMTIVNAHVNILFRRRREMKRKSGKDEADRVRFREVIRTIKRNTGLIVVMS